jgi:N-acetylglucosaminyl-diphospho-decaprenol L-rhamnosyltransferase
MSRPAVSVIVVSHGHAAFLPTCLASVYASWPGEDLEVFVVANLRDDGSAELVRESFPRAHLIENERPRGFAANNNAALRRSRGRYLLLLNPDTELRPGALEAMMAAVDGEERVGLCGPQLLYPDGRVQPSCRRFPTLASVIARRSPLRVFFRDSPANRRHLMADFDHSRASRVDWMLGACLLVRRDLLREVGLLDEGYFLYVEDIDWAYRARAAGWHAWYEPGARVVHHHLARSDRALLSRYSWLHLQSMWRFFRKHLAPPPLRMRVTHETLP